MKTMTLSQSRLLLAAAGAAALVAMAGPAVAWTVTGPMGMDWDVNDTGDGSIIDGENNTYDYAYTLTVNGTLYTGGGIAGTPILGGRGVRMAQQYPTSTLTVQRYAWVPATGTRDYLRYVDTFDNSGSAGMAVTVVYGGTLGAWWDAEVTATSDGDYLVEASDTWYCTHDYYSWTTPAGFVWCDGAALTPSSMSLATYSINTTYSFTIPPLSRVAIMVFAVQTATPSSAATTAGWLASLPTEALEGLAGTDLAQILNWQAGGAPIVQMMTTPLEVSEGQTLDMIVQVEDLEGDTFVVSWDTDGDGTYDDATGTSATFDATGVDGPASVQVGVRAVDSETNDREIVAQLEILNAEPAFLSDPTTDPGLTLQRGVTWSYQIVIEDPANAGGTIRDPLTVTVPTKPALMIFFGDMRLQWTPPETDDVVGDHTVRIEADDHDGGVGVQEFVLTIPENAPPGAPVIVYPNHDTVWTLRPELIVTNADDPDDDPLIYTFQVASSGDFSPSSLIAAAERPGGAGGQTSWTLNTDLADGGTYFWRVWANDGRHDGAAASTTFDVDLGTAPDETPEPVTDASTDVMGDPGTDLISNGGDIGCSCRAVPGAGTAHRRADPLIILAALAFACAALLVSRRQGA